MFGDTPLVGIYDKKLDNKGRVLIPAAMNAEEGDQVGLAYGEGNGELLIMTLAKFQELYSKLEAANQMEVLAQDIKLIEQMKQLIGISKVDKMGRVQIPKYALQKTGLEGNIVMVGQITCLGLYKSNPKMGGR